MVGRRLASLAGVQQDVDLAEFQEGDHGALYDLGGHQPTSGGRLRAICSARVAHCRSSCSDRPGFPEESASDFLNPHKTVLGNGVDAARRAALGKGDEAEPFVLRALTIHYRAARGDHGWPSGAADGDRIRAVARPLAQRGTDIDLGHAPAAGVGRPGDERHGADAHLHQEAPWQAGRLRGHARTARPVSAAGTLADRGRYSVYYAAMKARVPAASVGLIAVTTALLMGCAETTPVPGIVSRTFTVESDDFLRTRPRTERGRDRHLRHARNHGEHRRGRNRSGRD